MWRSGFGAIVLRDVARRPAVETGASVPGYSGGVAACAVFSYSDLLSPWVADPGRGAERLLAWSRMWRSGFGAIVLKDVAWGPSVEIGAGVPGQREVE
jgi:hypothetical protein